MIMQNTYKRNENVVYRNIADEAVLVPIVNNIGDLNCIYSLNATAALAWKEINGKNDFYSIMGKLLEEFSVEPAILEADLKELFLELESLGLIYPA